MKFSVPQIKYETKIVGPLTFKQFIYIGSASVIAFFLYFMAPFSVFILVSFILAIISFSLAFLKVGGVPLPVVLLNSLKFNISPKTYLWKKKETSIAIIQKKEVKTKEKQKKEPTPIEIDQKSRLKKLKIEIETKL